MSVPLQDIEPMLLSASRRIPEDAERWAFELKYDGFRAMVYVDDGSVRVMSKQQRDMSTHYPELQGLRDALRGRRAILDAELVAVTPDGGHDFELLQRRAGFQRDRRLAAHQVPVRLQLFDLLHVEGRSLLRRPYTERRARLLELELNGPHWCTPENFTGGDPAALWEATRQAGLEGIIAKRLDSPYAPGVRATTWRKLKNWRTQQFLIGGWRESPEGAGGWLDILLLGRERDGRLEYVGSAHPGFSALEHEALAELLPGLEEPESPFTATPHKKGLRFVRPVLVANIQFLEWTDAGLVRMATFRGFGI